MVGEEDEDEEGALGSRQTKREFEIETFRREKVVSAVHRTASSEGLPLIVSLFILSAD